MNETEKSATSEKLLRQELLGFLTTPERKSLQEIRLLSTLFSFLHIWLALLLSIFTIYLIGVLPIWASLPVSIVVILFVGTRQNALAVQVHEASHNLLLKNRTLNDLLCNCLAGYWILTDVASYRRVHLRHHTDLHKDTDPDRSLYLFHRLSRSKLTTLLLQDLIGVTAFKRFVLHFRAQSSFESDAKQDCFTRAHLFGKLLTQCLLLSLSIVIFGWKHGPVFYSLFWLVPLGSVYPMIVRLRIITEHFSPRLEANGVSFVSRTSVSTFMEEYLIGAEMQYHLEHHLLPNIPFRQLRRLHRLIVERGFFRKPDTETQHFLSGGYFRFWRLLFTQGDERKQAYSESENGVVAKTVPCGTTHLQ